MLPSGPDADHIHLAISHATAPAFLLGAVAGFLSVLVGRLDRVVDRKRTLLGGDAYSEEDAAKLARLFKRRMILLQRAIYFAVLSALVTAGLLTLAFVTALIGIDHNTGSALFFIVALGLLVVSLIYFSREIRVYMGSFHLE
ncbi:hypothetical protein M2321_000937 [Rhodoblastus acidophilus]|nr:DUF2721 domain-containing protein [Rhodoblastus acidophilus]MCW2273368.1 hypothetical protein [Rhodoblastus acidophilus]